MLAILFLMVGASYMLLKDLNASAGTLRAYRQQYDAKILAQAKEILLGYAAAYPEMAAGPPADKGPGYLPCPSADSNGDPRTSCLSTSVAVPTVGRLPWKYLGVPEMRDSSGELLWYAVADNYSYNRAGAPAYIVPLNSEKPPVPGAGYLTLDGATDIVAVIIAPGPPIGNQDRIANPDTASAYLEGGNGLPATTVFVSKVAGDPEQLTFNDHVIAITRDELMAVVEKRVARDARTALNRYNSNNGYFPYAALLGAPGPEPGRYVGWERLRRGLLPVDNTPTGRCQCNYDNVVPGVFVCACEGPFQVSGTGSGACTITPPAPPFPAMPTFCAELSTDTVTVNSTVGGPALFTSTSGACAINPGSPPNTCTCSGAGTCEAETSQHANPALTSQPPPTADLPSWFIPNEWQAHIYYTLASAADACEAAIDPTCEPDGVITVGNRNNVLAALITAGRPQLQDTDCSGPPPAVPNPAYAEQARPSLSTCDYLESQENNDNDDVYTQVGELRTNSFNDQAKIVAPPP